jgi:hypothetical protein
VTWLAGTHSLKFGTDIRRVDWEEMIAPANLFGMVDFTGRYTGHPYADFLLGLPNTASRAFPPVPTLRRRSTYDFFVQDDWKIRRDLTLNLGLRYDLHPGWVERDGRLAFFDVTSGAIVIADDGANKISPLMPSSYVGIVTASSQGLPSDTLVRTDRNNFAPRLGVAWSLDDKTVLRASTGMMFDQPILGGYEQALQLSGSPRAPVYTFSGTTAGAPAFPNGVTSGTVAQQSPWAVNPDFQVGHTWQSNAQVERELARDFTASVAVMYAKGDQLPVVNDVNLINPAATLADGRPIYSAAVNAGTRLDPRFNHIFEVQSIGESEFTSVTFQADKRFSRGLSFNVQYSVGKGTDDTPLRTQLTVQAEAGPSDPSNLKRDEGPNPLDMRHSLNGNIIYQTTSHASNAVVRQLLTGNQIGVLLQFNSGLPTNILANRDLNADATSSDRPLNVARNSLYLPVRKNVDLRYTRWIPIRGSVRAEVIAELKNVFNTQQMSGINTTTVVDTAGNPVSAIPADPYDFPNPSGFEQRKFQLGFKVRF